MVDIALRPAAAGVDKIHRFMTSHPNGFATLEEAAAAIAAYNPDRPRPRNLSGLMKNLRLRDDGRLHWHWDPRLMAQRPTSEPPSRLRQLEEVSSAVTVPTLLVRAETAISSMMKASPTCYSGCRRRRFSMCPEPDTWSRAIATMRSTRAFLPSWPNITRS